MKHVGMFFSNKDATLEAYRKHSQQANNMARSFSSVTVKPAEMKIITDDITWHYCRVEKYEDVIPFSGIVFDAVFSEVTDPEAKMFLVTRFRPRFDK